MCTSRYCTNTLYASLQFTDLYTWVSYLIQDQPELMKCTKCFCWGRKKKKQLKMIFSVVILIWVLALDKNSRPPKTRRTVRTNLLAVIEQIRVTSITAAHLSALIPPSHFTPFHLPLHKLCWQQGLAARNDPLSRSQLVKALPDWRFDRCYHGSLTTEECDKPHLLACDWQSGISPLSQTKHRPPPFKTLQDVTVTGKQQSVHLHSGSVAWEVLTEVKSWHDQGLKHLSGLCGDKSPDGKVSDDATTQLQELQIDP